MRGDLPANAYAFQGDMATIRDKVGHLETLPIDLLYAHLDVSFIFNHLDAMNGGPNSSVTARQKAVYNCSA
jgi:hypothetical protein